jgi:hypothetical protein
MFLEAVNYIFAVWRCFPCKNKSQRPEDIRQEEVTIKEAGEP